MSQLRSVFKMSKSTWQFECLSELECSGKVLVEYIVGLYWWSMLLEYTDGVYCWNILTLCGILKYTASSSTIPATRRQPRIYTPTL